jgi:hypothetical protein
LNQERKIWFKSELRYAIRKFNQRNGNDFEWWKEAGVKDLGIAQVQTEL